jgi:hypothetical protein
VHEADLEPGRPDADECLPYYFTYIDLVPGGHVVKLLERQIAESAAYLAAFRAPADWTIRSVRAVADAMAGHELHHLASVRRQHG